MTHYGNETTELGGGIVGTPPARLRRPFRFNSRTLGAALIAIAMIGGALGAESDSVADTARIKGLAEVIKKAMKNGTVSASQGKEYLKALESGELEFRATAHYAVKPDFGNETFQYPDPCDLPGAPQKDPACEPKGGGKGLSPKGTER